MRLFALIFVALATMQGCTYSEGPSLSFRSKAGRLDGRWNCTFLESGSAPRTGDSLIYTFDKKGGDLFADGGVGTAVTKTQITPGVYNTASVDLAWVWGETKENISIEQTWDGMKLGTKVYRILRMTNKEIWWENPSNKTKRIEFSRID